MVLKDFNDCLQLTATQKATRIRHPEVQEMEKENKNGSMNNSKKEESRKNSKTLMSWISLHDSPGVGIL